MNNRSSLCAKDIEVKSNGNLISDSIDSSAEDSNDKTDILSKLPLEITDIISTYMDAKSLSCAESVSKTWNVLFSHSNCWKHRLEIDFHINKLQLNQLEIRQHSNPNIFRQLYRKLYSLMQSQIAPNKSFEVINLLSNPAKKELVIACCLDENEYVLSLLGRDDYESMLTLAIYAKSHRVVADLVNLKLKSIHRCFLIACQSGNQVVVSYLLKQAQGKFTLSDNPDYLYKAVLSGNENLVHFLLEDSGIKFKYQVNTLLTNASHRGSQYLGVIKYILNYTKIPFSNHVFHAIAATGCKQELVEISRLYEQRHIPFKFISPIKLILNPLGARQTKKNESLIFDSTCLLQFASMSGNIDSVKYLVDEDNVYGVNMIFPNAFIGTAMAGNIDIYHFLINHANLCFANDFSPVGLPNDVIDTMLETAARHGNMEFLRYFFDKENKFNLSPNLETLNAAALSGSISLVSYFIDPKNGFNLTPDYSTLKQAIKSDSPELIYYLLSENNRFNIDINLGELSTDHANIINAHKWFVIIKLSEIFASSDDKPSTNDLINELKSQEDKTSYAMTMSFLDNKDNVHSHVPTIDIIIFSYAFLKEALNNIANEDSDLYSKLLISFSLSPRLFISKMSHILSPTNPYHLNTKQHKSIKFLILNLADLAEKLNFDSGDIALAKKLISQFDNASAKWEKNVYRG